MFPVETFATSSSSFASRAAILALDPSVTGRLAFRGFRSAQAQVFPDFMQFLQGLGEFDVTGMHLIFEARQQSHACDGWARGVAIVVSDITEIKDL